MLFSLISDEPINLSSANNVVSEINRNDAVDVLEHQILKPLDATKRIPITQLWAGVLA